MLLNPINLPKILFLPLKKENLNNYDLIRIIFLTPPQYIVTDTNLVSASINDTNLVHWKIWFTRHWQGNFGFHVLIGQINSRFDWFSYFISCIRHFMIAICEQPICVCHRLQSFVFVFKIACLLIESELAGTRTCIQYSSWQTN